MIAVLTSMLLGMIGWLVDQSLAPVVPRRDFMISGVTVSFPPIGMSPFRETQLYSPLTPWTSVARPAMTALVSATNTREQFSGATRSIIALAIWSLVGVILCRRAAFNFVGDDEYTVRQSIQFGTRTWLTALLTPAIPIVASAILGFIIVIIGLLGRLPLLGPTWLVVSSPLTTLLGLAVATLAILTAVAWPLMVAAVATDDCDNFGALSRAISGLTSKPWQLVIYATVCTVVAFVLMVAVTLFADTTVWCARTFATLGSGEELARQSLLGPVNRIVYDVTAGIAISYFWAAATLVYLFLRRDVDGIPLESLVRENDPKANHDPLPVVGIPATDAKQEQPAA